MKSLFIFDTILIKENNNYFGMTLTYDFFKERYLQFYDEMVISTRVKEKENVKENIEGYKITNGDSIEVCPIFNYKEIPDIILKRKKIYKELVNVINQADVVIIRMPSILGLLSCKICKKLNKKYLIEMVACAWDGYINHTNPIGKILAPIIFLKTKLAIKKSPEVLYVTEKFLQSRYPTKGNQIGCSDVILKPRDNDVLNNRITKIQNMNLDDEIKLCTVANVGMKYKGHIYAIKAISRLNKEGNHKYKYYLVGNGNPNRLKNIAKKYGVENDIIFLGSLPHNEVFNILNDIDIYIQPSLQEGLPRALLEAMSCACPCLGSTAGGIPELLEENSIFRKKDFKRIEFLIKNLDKETMVQNAKYCFKKMDEYDFDKLNKKRNQFYR